MTSISITTSSSSGRRRPPRSASSPPPQAAMAVMVTVFVFSLVVYISLLPVSSSKTDNNNGQIQEDINNKITPEKNPLLHPWKEVQTIEKVVKNEASMIANEGLKSVANKQVHQLEQVIWNRWLEGIKKQTTTTIGRMTTTTSTRKLPARLKALTDTHQIVGERLTDIQSGTETVPELLHRSMMTTINNNMTSNNNGGGGRGLRGGGGGEGVGNGNAPPMELKEIKEYLEKWLHSLHATLGRVKHANFEGIWEAYHDLTVQTLYVWDREYLSRMPIRREDDSIFLSLASYRDENCVNTLNWAYEKSKDPSKLFVGLVQQNCHTNCRSGIMADGNMEDVPPDVDCYQSFCDGPNKAYCSHIRLLDIDEPESLGPYAARYFASKLWSGEQWFMQTDAHMTFAQDWDDSSVKMLQAAPSKKPVISHYPPGHMADLEAMKARPASRLCGPIFATTDLESQIIRLEGSKEYDKVYLPTPRFAPFTAAGFFVAHSDFLREVPFDPFLPWIFMGEEIIMSTRLWTSGYDIFSPTHSVVGHIYVRRHKPKFWESVHRAFTFGVHNDLQAMILDRVKYQLGYPEAAKDFLLSKTLLTAVEQYSMGTARPLSRYLELVGLNMTTKEVTLTHWCEKGTVPPGFEDLSHFYET